MKVVLFLSFLISSLMAFAQSGPVITTNSLYVYVCGKSQKNCADAFVYKNHSYGIGFDYGTPQSSAKAKNNFLAKLDTQRTAKAKVIGPMVATITIQDENDGSTSLVILEADRHNDLFH